MIATLLRRAPGLRVTLSSSTTSAGAIPSWVTGVRIFELHATSASDFVIPSWVKQGPHPWVEEWHFRGRCSGTDVARWYGDEDGARPALNRRDLRELRELCGGCPVARTCLTHALREREEFGVWGGTSGRQRADMQKAIAAGVADIDEVVEAWLSQLKP